MPTCALTGTQISKSKPTVGFSDKTHLELVPIHSSWQITTRIVTYHCNSNMGKKWCATSSYTRIPTTNTNRVNFVNDPNPNTRPAPTDLKTFLKFPIRNDFVHVQLTRPDLAHAMHFGKLTHLSNNGRMANIWRGVQHSINEPNSKNEYASQWARHG